MNRFLAPLLLVFPSLYSKTMWQPIVEVTFSNPAVIWRINLRCTSINACRSVILSLALLEPAPTETPESAKAERSAKTREADTDVARGEDEGEEGEAAALDSIPAGPGVPDLAGMTLRLAVRALHERGLGARVEGSGVVVSQSPPAGSPALPGDVVLVRGRTDQLYVAAVARRPGAGR
jgi:hypothetical protein